MWHDAAGHSWRSFGATVMDVVQAINLLGEVSVGTAARAPAYLELRK